MNGGTEMDVREKLIEILRKPIFPHELADQTEAVADYLLDNGVTVQDRRQTKCNGKDAIIERECSEKQTSQPQ